MPPLEVAKPEERRGGGGGGGEERGRGEERRRGGEGEEEEEDKGKEGGEEETGRKEGRKKKERGGVQESQHGFRHFKVQYTQAHSSLYTDNIQVYIHSQHSQCIRTCSYHNSHHFGIAIEPSLYDLCTSKESVLLVFG